MQRASLHCNRASLHLCSGSATRRAGRAAGSHLSAAAPFSAPLLSGCGGAAACECLRQFFSSSWPCWSFQSRPAMGFELRVVNGSDMIGGTDNTPNGVLEVLRMRVASMQREERATLTSMGQQLLGLSDPVAILVAMRNGGAADAAAALGLFQADWSEMGRLRAWITMATPELSRHRLTLVHEDAFRRRMRVDRKCEACGKGGAKQCCGRCVTARYCDEECQKAAWAAHKNECRKPFQGTLAAALNSTQGYVVPREVCRALRIALVGNKSMAPGRTGGAGALLDDFLTFLSDAAKGLGFSIRG